ncbi:TPA: hypothetical protein MGM46_004486 [Salmonella enterica]|nr:hypothetical protein [Salmonella enterica]
MPKTGKGLPRSLVNAEFDIPAATTTAIGGVKKSATDVTSLRTAVINLLTALKNAGTVS